MPDTITLSSDDQVKIAISRLLHYCREEYEYYDGVITGDPNLIEPIDVLATVSVNAFFNATAAKIQRIHRGIAANCNDLLHAIPPECDLVMCSRSTRADLERLLHAAVQVPYVLIPVATKILHRKRPYLIPMLDNVLLEYYLNLNGRRDLWNRTQDKRRASEIAMTVLDFFSDDLRNILPQVEHIQGQLTQEGYKLSPVRILELLVWIEAEVRGYYRNP